MTRLEIYQRLRDIVDSSGVEDAPELTAYCDKCINSILLTMKPEEVKEREKKEKYKDYSTHLFQIMNDEEFMNLDKIMQKLYKTFPHKTWDKYVVKTTINEMNRNNLVERAIIQFQDEKTLKISRGRGFRLVRGARLR